MSIINANPLLAAAGGDYQISRSVRLRSSASAYFSRTPASAGNRQIWTWSSWVKRGTLGTLNRFFSAGATGPVTDLIFDTTDQLRFYTTDSAVSTSEYQLTTAVFRDPSAWYHIVCAIDTTQATYANRVKLYVNGVLQSVTVTNQNTQITQNANLGVNRADAHNIGRFAYSASGYFDGYLTEVNFIDGQALTPSSFGETDVITGVWKPKKYAGTYGTNGFYLNFSDNSAATAAAIGKDSSGNGNNWTPNNISVTSGSTYDSMIDTPTPYADGGNGRGNYCVLNPVDIVRSPTPTYSSANLAMSAGAAWAYSRSTILLPANVKIYAETTIGSSTTGTSAMQSGFGRASSSSAEWFVNFDSGGSIYTAGSLTASGLGALTAGDVIQFAYDGAGNAWMGKNNVWWNSTGGTTGNPATGANPMFTGLSIYDLFICTGNYSNSQNINFGQRPFAYTPPTGFKALNTQNLPDSTILKPMRYFDVSLYTGAGTTQSVTNSGSMQPDLVWLKSRSNTGDAHYLYDAVRGVTKSLTSNDTSAEQTIAQTLTSFDATGFTLGTVGGAINGAGRTFAAWQWRASNAAAVTNNAGSITSQVSANTTAGFSIVTYTGTGSAASVGHGLGVTPSMYITKRRSAVNSWIVYHKSLGNNILALESTSAQIANSAFFSSFPNSSSFYPSTDATVNASGGTYVTYCFSEVAGFSRFGSYTGNGSTDGPFVYCGFRPRWIMLKRTDGVSNWFIRDTARSQTNGATASLFPNLSDAEVSGAEFDILSNGFKVRSNASGVNGSGETIIFAAFAENPFKNSLAR